MLRFVYREPFNDALALFDRLVLSVPGLGKLGGMGVMHGHLTSA